MQIELLYGRRTLPVSFPHDADVHIVRKIEMPVVADPTVAVTQALARPVESDPLEELARRGKTACIAICDITRPVPNHLFLRPLIESLLRGGLSASDIHVLVATGLHRPNEGDELATLIGDPWVLANVSVVNHHARHDDEHTYVGTTSTRGTVVRLDRRFVEADLRIATGLVEPHFMAGYSGGRKVIAPGLAHAETITTFHNARFMSDPHATNCNLHQNPLHEEQLEIVRMLGGALALNTVIDEHRRLSFVNFGEIAASHAQAVQYVRQYCEIPLPRRFPTVVTSAAGYPLDTTYYQTVKGMVGGTGILAPGGDLVIVSSCSEGFGSHEFLAAQRALIESGRESFLQRISSQSHARIDEWQTQMQIKAMDAGRVFLYTQGLSQSERAATGLTLIDDIDQTIHSLVMGKSDRTVAVIPEGPYVVPFCRNPVQ